MTCDEIERAIPWFLDDELEASIALEVEAHLLACASCRAALAREGRLRLVLRRAASQVTASAALRRSVRESIERERRSQSPMVRAWPAVAAAAILVAFIWKGAAATPASDLEAVTRMRTDLPMDVVAADVAQVQEYFNRRLPFAVRLPQVAPGNTTLGGRIVHLRNHDAALVRYNMPRGRLSVFVYTNGEDDYPEVAPLYRLGNQRMLIKELNGHTVARWRSAGLTYSVVTDLSASELSAVIRTNRW